MTIHTGHRRWLVTGFAIVALATSGWPGGARPAHATAATAQQNDAESSYREARRELTRGNFRQAIELLSALRDEHPSSVYAGDSYYWQAFSLYRLDALRDALALLDTQLATYPNASTAGDARDLELRIRDRLGQRGDPVAAELSLRIAQATLEQELGRNRQSRASASYVYEQALANSTMVSEIALRRAAGALAAIDARGMTGSFRAQEGCEDEQVQQAALQALMQMDSDRALPILEKVLARRDECSVPLRKQAVFVLSQHDPDVTESIIVRVARNDPEPEVQEAAIFWLSQVGSESALDALMEILAASDAPRLQENAIFALSQHASPRAGEILRGYALDTTRPERIREKAIFWLSQHPNTGDADFLITLYEGLESESLRESVFFSLAQLNDASAVDWMLERALDSSESTELRKQALFWAGQDSTVDLDQLGGLYQRLDNREMKEQLIFLYAQRDESAAVDRLIEIARVESDPELRKRVVFWLGQTGDDRAIDYLLELVGDPPR